MVPNDDRKDARVLYKSSNQFDPLNKNRFSINFIERFEPYLKGSRLFSSLETFYTPQMEPRWILKVSSSRSFWYRVCIFFSLKPEGETPGEKLPRGSDDISGILWSSWARDLKADIRVCIRAILTGPSEDFRQKKKVWDWFSCAEEFLSSS